MRHVGHFASTRYYSVYSLAAGDPYFNNVTLLLHGTGADGSTSIVDSSLSTIGVTANGNTVISTANSKFGTSSIYTGGTASSFASFGSAGVSNFGTSDFTIECWVYPISHPGTYPCIFGNYNNFGTGALAIFAGHAAADSSKFQLAVNGSFPAIQSTTSIAYNTWQHIAIVRYANTLYFYINGTLDGTCSVAGVSLDGVGANSFIGCAGDNTSAGYFNGYIDEFRITSGIARYTNNFTVPSAAFPNIAQAYDPYYNNVTLLLHGNGTNGSTTIVDSSMSVNVVTPINSAQISTTQSKFSGTSIALTSAGDYLTIPLSNYSFPGNFTIEGWFFATSLATAGRLIYGGNSGPLDRIQVWVTTSGGVGFETSNGIATGAGGSTSINTWNHFALVRNGSTVTLYLNGTSVASGTDGAAIDVNSNAIIGAYRSGGAPAFQGYIDDIRITNGVARYTSNFTTPTAAFPSYGISDPYYNKVVMLLHGTGANGSTTFTDNSRYAINENPQGPITISTSQSKFNNSSIALNGNGYLYPGATATRALGTGDFTLEAWLYPTSWASVLGCVYDTLGPGGPGARPNSMVFYIDGSVIGPGYPSVYSNSTRYVSPVAISLNTWTHVAWVRASGVLTIFINGLSVYTSAFTTDDTNGGSILGAADDVRGQSSYTFQGYLDEVRLTKGVARYTSDFSVPSAPFPNS